MGSKSWLDWKISRRACLLTFSGSSPQILLRNRTRTAFYQLAERFWKVYEEHWFWILRQQRTDYHVIFIPRASDAKGYVRVEAVSKKSARISWKETRKHSKAICWPQPISLCREFRSGSTERCFPLTESLSWLLPPNLFHQSIPYPQLWNLATASNLPISGVPLFVSSSASVYFPYKVD